MRVVFLDVDGVLCCHIPEQLDDRPLNNLKMILEQTDARIVISSDWRRIPHLRKRLQKVLEERCGAKVIGFTPQTRDNPPQRPVEISRWLKAYNAAAPKHDKEVVTKFCAIDDRALLEELGGDVLKGSFVQTTFHVGLTVGAAKHVIQILLEENTPIAPRRQPSKPRQRTLKDSPYGAPKGQAHPHTGQRHTQATSSCTGSPPVDATHPAPGASSGHRPPLGDPSNRSEAQDALQQLRHPLTPSALGMTPGTTCGMTLHRTGQADTADGADIRADMLGHVEDWDPSDGHGRPQTAPACPDPTSDSITMVYPLRPERGNRRRSHGVGKENVVRQTMVRHGPASNKPKQSIYKADFKGERAYLNLGSSKACVFP